MKIMASFMGFLVLLILLPAPARADQVGRITYVEGKVDIISPGQITRPACLGYEVHVGDIIHTKSRSKAEITFTDATIMQLAQKSNVEISEYVIGKSSRRVIIRLFRGKIHSVVSKFLRMSSFSSRNRYEVHTPTAVAGVRGTDFFVYYQGGVTGLVFKEGLGYGYSQNRPLEIREIEAGQAMRVLSADQPPAIRSFSNLEIQKHLGDTEPLEKHERKAEEKDELAMIAEGTLPETGSGFQGNPASAQRPEAPELLQSEGLLSLMDSPEVVASLEPVATHEAPAADTDTEITDIALAPDTSSPNTTLPVILQEPGLEWFSDFYDIHFRAIVAEAISHPLDTIIRGTE